MLGPIFGLLVSEIATLIIKLFGLLMGLGIYVFGIIGIKKIINDEDDNINLNLRCVK